MSFAVIGYQRTGTIMLTTALNSHPQILCEGVLRSNEAKAGVDNEHNNIFKIVKKKYNEKKKEKEFISNLLKGKDLSTVKIWGYNTKYTILNINDYKNMLKNIQIIHILRNNLFENSLSVVTNASKERFNVPAHDFDDIEVKKEFVLSDSDIHKIIKRGKIITNSLKRWKNIFKSHRNYIELSYEDLTSGNNISKLPEQHSDILCDFLGVDILPLSVKIYKTGTKVINRIKNFHEAKECFYNELKDNQNLPKRIL